MSANSSPFSTTRPLALWLLLFCAAMNLYLLGAAALLGVVGYPLLGQVSSDGLHALHAALTMRLRIVFILPEFLAFLSVLPLLRLRPPRVPIPMVWACVLLGVAYFIVTFGWHLPAHKLIAGGDSATTALPSLLFSHAVRTITVACKCAILLWMIARAVLPARIN